jgi:L-lactate dehydrogenase (cytochrome)
MGMKRRVPGLKHFKNLLRFKQPLLSGKARRLRDALTIEDLRMLAKKRTPAGPFDYVDGSAESELTLNRARGYYSDLQFHPHILRDVTHLNLETTILGERFEMPFGISPTGFTRMMHIGGELAGSKAAERAGIPFVVSTLGTTSIGEVAKNAPTGRNWFQLYMWKDRSRSLDLIQRAEDAGVDVLFLTVDVPVAGARLRDVRNGLTIPPTLTTKTVMNILSKPRWWGDFLTTPPLEFASLSSWNGTVAELLDSMFDPSITFADLDWIRSEWSGKIVIKGIQRVDDARLAVEHGADALLLSSHGGRQIDRAVPPMSILEDVVQAVGGRAEVHVDTGIMRGSDIVAALAKGANFAWVGRAYLYGLMAGGEDGVSRAIEILRSQVVRTMKLLGATSISELETSHVSLLPNSIYRG